MSGKRPRDGWVYFVTSGDYIKVGWATDLGRRLECLRAGNPEPMELVCAFRGTISDEHQIHRALDEARLVGREEWFHAGPTRTLISALLERDYDLWFPVGPGSEGSSTVGAVHGQ